MATPRRKSSGHVSADAEQAVRAFTAGVAAEQHAAHREGVPYPIAGAAGRIVWVHPDGSHRSGIAPGSTRLD